MINCSAGSPLYFTNPSAAMGALPSRQISDQAAAGIKGDKIKYRRIDNATAKPLNIHWRMLRPKKMLSL